VTVVVAAFVGWAAGALVAGACEVGALVTGACVAGWAAVAVAGAGAGAVAGTGAAGWTQATKRRAIKTTVKNEG